MSELLPDSRMKQPTGEIRAQLGGVSLNLVPFYCANCGTHGGHSPVVNTAMFWLCPNCAQHWNLANTMLIPDEVFAQKVKEAMIDKFGRVLSAQEIAVQLQDSGSLLSKLKKEHDHALGI